MGTLSIRENVLLAPFTTIGVGGAARFFAHVETEKELEEAVAFQQSMKLPFAILGGGSNLLIRDEGFPGLVVHLEIKGEMQLSDTSGHIQCKVPAGISWDDFVLDACKQNLTGVECLAGIPGLTGGTPVQNVGAYGQDVAQTIRDVRVYDLHSRAFVEFSKEECRFEYRSSRFNMQDFGRYVICQVTFDLTKNAPPALNYSELQQRFLHRSPSPLEIYQAVREIRREKGMLVSIDDPDSRSAGSFFKNPIVSEQRLAEISSSCGGDGDIPHWLVPSIGSGSRLAKVAAAWLVQRAGFPKGFTDGRAGISGRHSLALINRGGATFADIARLRDRIKAAGSAKFQVELEQEPIELGPTHRR